MTVSPLVWEDDTLLTCAVLRTTSLMWLSHMPHIIPWTFKIVSTISVLLSGSHQDRAMMSGFCHFVSFG